MLLQLLLGTPERESWSIRFGTLLEGSMGPMLSASSCPSNGILFLLKVRTYLLNSSETAVDLSGLLTKLVLNCAGFLGLIEGLLVLILGSAVRLLLALFPFAVVLC